MSCHNQWLPLADMSAEKALFHARKRTIDAQKKRLRERVYQLAQEAAGLEVRRRAKDDELRLVEQELASVAGLHSQGLMLFPPLAGLEGVKGATVGETRPADGGDRPRRHTVALALSRWSCPDDAPLADIGSCGSTVHVSQAQGGFARRCNRRGRPVTYDGTKTT
jgi:hypothetical protein